MGVWYHRLMAHFYMKWNPEGFQKHVRKLKERLEINLYFLLMNAPPEILNETETFKARLKITGEIWYDVEIKVSEVKKLLEVEKNEK